MRHSYIKRVTYAASQFPPVLSLTIHHAPHRRMNNKFDAVLKQYREDLVAALTAAGVPLPIRHSIDLDVLFVKPTSPDLDNLITALFQALDGKTLKVPGLLADDGQISKVTMMIL